SAVTVPWIVVGAPDDGGGGGAGGGLVGGGGSAGSCANAGFAHSAQSPASVAAAKQRVEFAVTSFFVMECILTKSNLMNANLGCAGTLSSDGQPIEPHVGAAAACSNLRRLWAIPGPAS
ncbi:MAG TPA: hypothetical protein VFK02_04570, partial [Kofleriaceae bacterium]|nr:hypothetical protein [Kofleriaceae bacterium]